MHTFEDLITATGGYLLQIKYDSASAFPVVDGSLTKVDAQRNTREYIVELTKVNPHLVHSLVELAEILKLNDPDIQEEINRLRTMAALKHG